MMTRFVLLGIMGGLPLGIGLWAQTPVVAPKDPIAKLKQQIQSGAVKLDFDADRGYLKSVLKHLEIDPESQTLVFSKGSMQASHINRENPRAIYFNDRTYVGWIPGAPVIELMTVQNGGGVRFYTIPNEKPNPKPEVTRETSKCIPCHSTAGRGRGPVFFANSTFTAESGYERIDAPTYIVRQSTKFANRWGGWYVTGTHGTARHMGNEIAAGDDNSYKLNAEAGANLTDLRKYLDPKAYLTAHSDISALLVMEHQMEVHNRLNAALVDLTEARTQAEIEDAVEPLVNALAGADEIRLPTAVKGTSQFATVYPKQFPVDNQGRSLGQLDLNSRVYKFGISPLLYDELFGSLPKAARFAVYRGLSQKLSQATERGALAQMTSAEREVAKEILRNTIPEFSQAVPR